MIRRIAIFFVTLLALPLAAQQLPIARGDVLIVASIDFYVYPLDPPVQELQHFGGDGNFKAYLEYEPGLPIVTNRTGHFFALQSGGFVEEEDAERQVILRRTKFREANNVALTVNDANDLYVLGTSGLLYVDVLRTHLRWVVQLPGIGNPVITASIDLSSDGCTLFYTDGGTGGIRRYDTCRSRSLPAIAPEMRYQNVRALADGGVVASRDGSLDFYGPDGHLALSGLFINAFPITAMAFDVDPAYVWLAAGRVLMKVRIRDRQPMTSASVKALGITVPGETRPLTPVVMPGRPRAVRH
jgi:hypothetical protein